MLTSLLATDLLAKLALYVGAPVFIALIVWFNGYGRGIAKEQEKQKEAKEAQDRAIRGAQARNATEDWKRDQRINEINNLKSTLDLVNEWNKRWGEGKTGHEEDKPKSDS